MFAWSAHEGIAMIKRLTVGGRYWEYGTSNGFVQSFYSHASKTHKATACDGKNRCAYSGWKPKGAYASAIRDKTASGNTAYWGVK